MIALSKQSGAEIILMQIHIPPNYGQRYTESFDNIYSTISKKENIPLIPFFMRDVVMNDGWMMKDGLHPTEEAQPWIADFVASKIVPLINQQG